jgi:signal transduction histidine kinase
MDEMTQAIMSLCQVTRGGVKRSVVDLGQIARECIATLRDCESGRDVTISIAPGLWAVCDPGLVKLALHNLLANAWKYTSQESHPSIEVGAEEGPDQEMRYFVRDNGIGFAVADATGIFEPFERLHGQSFAGQGIGLATVKRVVDKHGGAVWAVARPGEGSTFYFTLPDDDR